jgi:hypothetical protein
LRTSAWEIAASLVGPPPRLRLPRGAEAPLGVGAGSAPTSSVGRAADSALSPATGSTALGRDLRVGSGSTTASAAALDAVEAPSEPPQADSAAADATTARTPSSMRRRRDTGRSMPIMPCS